ncbi:MAG: hypothetical protein H8D38_04660 [DPANN group archaeon]|nr:hypothetical protein [DPANN group archaeon]
MNKKGVEWTIVTVAKFILILVLLGVILWAVYEYGVKGVIDSQKCESLEMTECMTVEKCMEGSGVIFREKKCEEKYLVCCVKSKERVKRKVETDEGEPEEEVETGPVRFSVSVDDKEITLTADLKENTNHEFKVYAVGEHVNLCRVRILYDEEKHPEGKLRTIKVTDLFNCTKGTSFTFKPISIHTQYEPLELDFVAFAKNFEGEREIRDIEATNSYKFYLKITNECKYNLCEDIDKNQDECQKCASTLNCYWHDRIGSRWDKCETSCAEITYCGSYKNRETCNENPCQITGPAGIGSCAWSTYSNGYCHVCGDFPNTNNCDEYKDEKTCNINPCDYNSCKWSSGTCVEG